MVQKNSNCTSVSWVLKKKFFSIEMVKNNICTIGVSKPNALFSKINIFYWYIL